MKSALLLVLFLSVANCMVIKCSFFSTSWYSSGTFYTCYASIINSGTKMTLEEVRGDHEEARSSLEVEAFHVNGQVLEKFPTNLAEFLPNLKIISCVNSKLKEILPDDLRPFPNLMYLALAITLLSLMATCSNTHLVFKELFWLKINCRELAKISWMVWTLWGGLMFSLILASTAMFRLLQELHCWIMKCQRNVHLLNMEKTAMKLYRYGVLWKEKSTNCNWRSLRFYKILKQKSLKFKNWMKST